MADKVQDLGQIKIRATPEEKNWWAETARAYGLKSAQALIMKIVGDYFFIWKANEDLRRQSLGLPAVAFKERPAVIDERQPRDVILEKRPASKKAK